MKFPLTVAAAKASERCVWNIGEAMLKEVEEEREGPRGFKAVVEELQANGVEYSCTYLIKLYHLAKTYGKADRHMDVSTEVHIIVMHAVNLNKIVKILRKEGLKPSIKNVTAIIEQLQRDKKAEQDKEAEDAAEAEKEARNRRKDAAKRERNADNPKDREKARRDKEEAAQQEQDAAEIKEKNRGKGKPRKKEVDVPDNLSPLVVSSSFISNANKARQLAEKNADLISSLAIPPADVAVSAMIDRALTAINAWRSVVDTLRKMGNFKALSVVDKVSNE